MQLFVVVVFLSHVAMVAAVAGCHSDRDKDHRPRKNCTAAGFSDVPSGLEPTTKVFLFPSNLFSSLSWSSFQSFTEIYEIDLNGNKVPTVTPSVAAVLPSLSVLRLGSNRLTSLSDGSFSACPALTELYLDNNAINSLTDHTFSGLSKLEILDLSSNHIRVLPLLLLHPLPAIETLILENNKIKVLPDNWFVQKEEVPYLYLSANPWVCSCSLDYLRTYLEEYELNIYVRDGPIISGNVESVVCDSPQLLKGKPVINLDASEFCSTGEESGPIGDVDQPITTNAPFVITIAATIPAAPTTPIPTLAPSTPPAIPPSTPPAAPPAIPPSTPPAIPPATPPAIPPSTPPAIPPATPPATPPALPEFTRVATWLPSFTAHPTLSTVRPKAESLFPPDGATIVATTKSAETTKDAPTTSYVTSTMPKLHVVTTAGATELTTVSTPSWVINKVAGDQRRSGAAAGIFCFWLFAGGVLLCVAAAACALVTLAKLVVWYRRVYKPLSATLAMRGRGGGEGARLLREEQGAADRGGGGGGGGVMALYRSVLFVSREEGEAEETGGGGKEVVTLELTAGEEEKEGGREERGVYRKVLYRLVSKQEEVEGWRDVMEECRVSAEDGGRKCGGVDGGGGGVSRKRYSVILREEREEAGVGREELDWVVGGWEVKKGEGGEQPRSSWGEWLDHYLPSMPWGVTTPPEGDAAQ